MSYLVLALTAAAAFAAGCDGDAGGTTNGEGGGNEVARVPAEELLSRDPFLGVSCRTPNSFACDRVGLAVRLREPAVRVEAKIAGRKLELDDPESIGAPEDGERRMFAGLLRPAGLIDGPLQIAPDAGPDRWIGRKPVSATVDLWIVHQDGAISTTSVEVGLSAGWG